MKLSRSSTLPEVAILVGDALRRAGIHAVLTGGACASLYSKGAYASMDADFVLSGSCTRAQVDAAMATLGFERRGDRYIHPDVPYYVEFPRGPLGIGEDFAIDPVWTRRRAAKTLVLSATDACRDRLAAFYHWNDRQALEAAVQIARRHRVSLIKIRTWSRAEDQSVGYQAFITELRRARRSSRTGRVQ